MIKATITIQPIQKTLDLPLYISFYVENGYIIMNFNKRIILNNENKGYWIKLLNEVADKKKARIQCALTCRDELQAKLSLKKLGLLEPKITEVSK